jgi:hypothetical protein
MIVKCNVKRVNINLNDDDRPVMAWVIFGTMYNNLTGPAGYGLGVIGPAFSTKAKADRRAADIEAGKI